MKTIKEMEVLSEHLKRERRGLCTSISHMDAFMKSEYYRMSPLADKALARAQRLCMRAYRHFLDKRIERE